MCVVEDFAAVVGWMSGDGQKVVLLIVGKFVVDGLVGGKGFQEKGFVEINGQVFDVLIEHCIVVDFENELRVGGNGFY